ncbi:MAG: hypothetical protein ACD_15C00066G0009 [uncultured bacterium]|nr:MAG: hypothetical protein ACD_15C00066G0009 [uncultured bacterium]
MLNKLISNFWNNFKTQPDVWFFYAFLATFVFSIRKVILFHPINNRFNEYSGIFLYLSDIFLIMTFIAWIIFELYHKKSQLSIKKPVFVPRLAYRQAGGTLMLIFALLSWSLISILWSENKDIAFFRFIKLLEFSLLSIFIVKKIVPRGTILKNSFKIIIASAITNSFIGIWQFITQHSIGLFWLKESLISPTTPGVAKIIFNEEPFVRSYGLFPHPNIFGGFLLFSLSITYIYYKLFHVEQLSKNKVNYCSTWNNKKIILNKISGDILYIISNKKLIFSIQIIALLFTFSKSAILGLIITALYIFKISIPPQPSLKKWHKSKLITFGYSLIVPRGTIITKKLFLFSLIITTLFVIAKPNIYSLLFKSLDERMIYLNVSRETILSNSFFGLGSGQFVTQMQSYTNLNLLDWQFQPVHNVFLLIFSELGIIGLIIFITLLYKLFFTRLINSKEKQSNIITNVNCSTWNNKLNKKSNLINNVPRGTFTKIYYISKISRGVLLGLIFIMLFDHYLWDIQQGEILLFITFALAGYSNDIKN